MSAEQEKQVLEQFMKDMFKVRADDLELVRDLTGLMEDVYDKVKELRTKIVNVSVTAKNPVSVMMALRMSSEAADMAGVSKLMKHITRSLFDDFTIAK